jgi:hypothetical protein
MDDRIYVIYRNGKRYEKSGRKIAYLTRSAAKGVITTDSAEIARQRTPHWYRLSQNQREVLTAQVAEAEFEIVEYAPISKEEVAE